MRSWGWITRFETALTMACAHVVLNPTTFQHTPAKVRVSRKPWREWVRLSSHELE